MNTKTPGEIAYTTRNNSTSREWIRLLTDNEREMWEAAAAAVISHHEAQKSQPWTLTAPPPGHQWHRNDWTAEMLPDGWRPMLLNESGDSERLNSRNKWEHVNYPDLPVQTAGFYRTRRPLPPTHDVTITLQPITLTSGKFSLAAI